MVYVVKVRRKHCISFFCVLAYRLYCMHTRYRGFFLQLQLSILMSVFVAYCDKYYYDLADKSRLKQVDVNDLVKDIRERSNMNDEEIFNMSAMYEILLFDRGWPSSEKIIQTSSRFVNRLYIDIEKLPISGSKNIVRTIADDFIKYAKENLKLYKFDVNDNVINIDVNNNEPFESVNTDYVITYNSSSSSHFGDSYHVIFPHIYVYHVEQVKSFMNDFINKHRQYIDYVDLSVYSTRRLFRLPFSKNVTYCENKTINQNDIHKTEFKQVDNEDNITDYIIQYVQQDGHIIVIDRNDSINFVSRIKQQKCSGVLSKQLVNNIDNTIMEPEEKPEEKLTALTNEDITKEINDINTMLKQLMERQQKLTALLTAQQK